MNHFRNGIAGFVGALKSLKLGFSRTEYSLTSADAVTASPYSVGHLSKINTQPVGNLSTIDVDGVSSLSEITHVASFSKINTEGVSSDSAIDTYGEGSESGI